MTWKSFEYEAREGDEGATIYCSRNFFPSIAWYTHDTAVDIEIPTSKIGALKNCSEMLLNFTRFQAILAILAHSTSIQRSNAF